MAIDKKRLNQFIANKIKQIRHRSNWTQQNVADIIGMKKTTFQSYELGYSTINISLLMKLCRVFEVHVDYFLPNLEDVVVG